MRCRNLAIPRRTRSRTICPVFASLKLMQDEILATGTGSTLKLCKQSESYADVCARNVSLSLSSQRLNRTTGPWLMRESGATA